MAKIKCPRCYFVSSEGDDRCAKCGTPLPKIRIEAKATPPAGGADSDILFRRGQIVANRYSVLNLIGRGGMGCIYKVHDNTLGETVALKTLLPQFLKDRLVVERFFNEAKIARKLAHPNIVRVHDIGTAGKVVYISMEYLQGKSLRALLEAQPTGRRLPLKQALRIIEELCASLEYAHQYTIHRDIKPENVMIGTDGGVKLMDFGISKLMANTRMTGASVVMGTPFYMSPEQLRNSRDVDARADIFSVGVVLYEILTGNVPTGVPKPVSEIVAEVPHELDKLITRCVEPDPKDRYQNATELRQAINDVRAGVDDTVELATGRPTRKAKAGRFPWRMAIGLALAMGILAGTGGALLALEERRTELIQTAAAAELEAATGPSVSDNSFAAYNALIENLRTQSRLAAGNSEDLRGLYTLADENWETAKAHHRNQQIQLALSKARDALQYYLAPMMTPLIEGMRFVPPGKVSMEGVAVPVAAFFVDEHEVTLDAFSIFCRQADGGWKDGFVSIQEAQKDYPVTNVTYYDAQAFAAWSGKRLPSDVQWAYAAFGGPDSPGDFPWSGEYEQGSCNCETRGPTAVGNFGRDLSWAGCYDMVGNVSEWTRTPYDAVESAEHYSDVWFDDLMTVCGGNYQTRPQPLNVTTPAKFNDRHPALGFRCILEIPTDVQAAHDLLRNL